MKTAIIKTGVLTTKGLVCGTCNHYSNNKCVNDISCGLKVSKHTLGCTHHQDCKIRTL